VLFGTAGDVLAYLEIIRKGGAPLLSRASTARMSTSQIESSIGAHSIGWFCAGNDFLPKGDLFSGRSFGHSGFTGAVALIDPEYDVSLVLLTNRVLCDPNDNRRFLKLRRLWTNAVAAAVTSG
jgi:CubicO group peptidase (beta-lactamase class C family)